MQQVFGLAWDPESIWLDADIRDQASIPTSTYFDFMHTLFASGGTYQFALNQTLHAFARSGFPLRDIDVFQATVILPKVVHLDSWSCSPCVETLLCLGVLRGHAGSSLN